MSFQTTITETEAGFIRELQNQGYPDAAVRTKLIVVSSAELLALFTTPKELVAAPGAGYIVEFISAMFALDHGGTDYTTRGDLTVNTGTTGTALSDTMAAADLVQASADAVRVLQALSADAQLDPNESLVLKCATGNPAAGDGKLNIRLSYRILPTGL